ncbi:hypothetical protein POX_c04596 [Penicillium oxalicum]|uniref:hypothetical protein n=1 Tax=Penicillium oxalicum TaxID=69781 RepID=UPI0020B8AAF8|nr:hypothetical protein POX_c04596 [Penicillium oxalicum]KAI2791721.1 hypothetical protein POX_c04596 [Penicillium oxalicum]
MPSAGIRAGLQLPLFYVAACKKDGAHKIARMVARSRSGIIRKLYDRNLASPRGNWITVTALGPYGRPENLLRFGTVVLVVEDVGFFRALSYIEMLVKASVQRTALVRKLEILWQDDAESNYPPWVKEWRQEVPSLDHPTSGGFDVITVAEPTQMRTLRLHIRKKIDFASTVGH